MVLVALLALLPFPTCIVRLAFHVPCPGCGVTRAALLLVRGELRASMRMHPLVAPGALAAALTLVVALSVSTSDAVWDRGMRRGLAACGLALMAVWALRLVGLVAPV